MTQFVPYLLRTGSVLAVAAFLSACSSSNNTTPPSDTGPTADQVARTSITGLNASVATLATLSAADDQSGSALMMAKESSAMIGTLASDGNSMKAMESAQKVLDAHKSLQDALTAAKTAKTAAEEAKGKLPADAEPLLVTALDDAIKQADTQIAAAQKILDGDTLESYVALVRGTDADNPHTPADQGMTVAKAIAAALAPQSADDGRPVRYAFQTTPPSDTVLAANKVELDDHKGRTWAAIVGASNLEDRQINTGATANATRTVKVASIAGLKVADVFGTGTTLDAGTGLPSALPSGGDLNGHEETTATGADTTTNHRGIPGTVICGGTDCKAENGLLTGSWYFTPTDPTAYWLPVTGETTFMEETHYTRYGHWLTVAANGDASVWLYAGHPSGIPSDIDKTGKWGADATLDATASYSGNAAGRSVRKTFDTNGKQTDIQSGRFTADVNLTAEFGGTRHLSGTVTNFESPDNPRAVHPDWSVTLKGPGTNDKAVIAATGTLSSSPTAENRGVTQATGANGAWSATSYGEADERPAGIHGWFNAHFTNGHAAGAYATRKDD